MGQNMERIKLKKKIKRNTYKRVTDYKHMKHDTHKENRVRRTNAWVVVTAKEEFGFNLRDNSTYVYTNRKSPIWNTEETKNTWTVNA